jgi:hypothetical protein
VQTNEMYLDNSKDLPTSCRVHEAELKLSPTDDVVGSSLFDVVGDDGVSILNPQIRGLSN